MSVGAWGGKIWGFCEICGASRTSAIVETPEGKRSHAIGLQCSEHPEHGPDTGRRVDAENAPQPEG